MSTTTHLNEAGCLALSAGQVAKLLGISLRHLWSLNASGRLPRPIRFGRSVRWLLEELQAWLAAGAPERCKREAMRGREISPQSRHPHGDLIANETRSEG